MTKINYYHSFDQDFSESKQQNYQLPKDYQWINHKLSHRIISALLYPLGYYIYSTHTQVFGDVVNHFITTFPTRPYLICSPANLGIVAVGKYLPLAGALPVPDNIHQLQQLSAAIKTRLQQGKAIITYPEAHVWPWYTDIRPMSPAAFHYPATIDAPVFVATTTYQKSRFHKKPKITIFLDGPIKIDHQLPRKEKARQIQAEVTKIMKNRATKYSNYSYIEYRPKN